MIKTCIFSTTYLRSSYGCGEVESKVRTGVIFHSFSIPIAIETSIDCATFSIIRCCFRVSEKLSEVIVDNQQRNVGRNEIQCRNPKGNKDLDLNIFVQGLLPWAERRHITLGIYRCGLIVPLRWVKFFRLMIA